jgi:hypothetical protein
MTAEELQQRFVAEIEKRAVDDKYIDGLEERELLQIGLQHGYSTEQARSFLVAVCAQRGYVIEAAVVQRIRESLRRRERINRQSFEDIVNETRPAIAGTTRNDSDLRRLVVTTLDDSAARIRRGWFSDWYARLKRDLGGV